MKNVLKRLKEEYLDISIKCDKLDIHKEYIKLMENQLELMFEYRECLYQRYKYICKYMNED